MLGYLLKKWLPSQINEFLSAPIYFTSTCFALCWGWIGLSTSFGNPTLKSRWYWLVQALVLLLPSTLQSIIQKLYVLSNNLIFEYIYSAQLLKFFLIKDSFIKWLCHDLVIFQVEKLVLIDASVYTEGTGNLATLPRAAAYAGVSISPT
jgi:hypothetical protein